MYEYNISHLVILFLQDARTDLFKCYETELYQYNVNKNIICYIFPENADNCILHMFQYVNWSQCLYIIILLIEIVCKTWEQHMQLNSSKSNSSMRKTFILILYNITQMSWVPQSINFILRIHEMLCPCIAISSFHLFAQVYIFIDIRFTQTKE